jgi:TrmH family RNA methyltransferase
LITSPDNPALKEVRRLRAAPARARSGLFAAEGEDLLAAADSNGWQPVRRLVAAGSGLPGEEVEPELLASVSSLGSGTRAIGVFRRSFSQLPSAGMRVHLHGLSDPGNVGTCIRSAHALGAVGVGIGPGTADPFGPKAVRASMGSIFALPVAEVEDPLALPGPKIALVAHGGGPDLPDRVADPVVVVGSERDGLPGSVAGGSDFRWTIPITEGAESLNAAAACAIALHAVNRISGR